MLQFDKTLIKEFDKFLRDEKDVLESKIWINSKTKTPERVTLHTYIRNAIHHPENKENGDEPYNDEELRTSIKEMIELLDKANKDSQQT